MGLDPKLRLLIANMYRELTVCLALLYIHETQVNSQLCEQRCYDGPHLDGNK